MRHARFPKLLRPVSQCEHTPSSRIFYYHSSPILMPFLKQSAHGAFNRPTCRHALRANTVPAKPTLKTEDWGEQESVFGRPRVVAGSGTGVFKPRVANGVPGG